MYKIKTFNKILEAGRRAFNDNYVIGDEEKNYDAIIVHSIPLHDEVFPDTLKAIVRVGAGVNTIPVEKCTKEGNSCF